MIMKLTFLGTGTSQGVPIIGCNCNVCQSTNPKDKRLRTSVLIEINNHTFVIDSGPDFRQQMLREKVQKLDAIIFTHEHKDHTGGLDDVRAFNYIQKKPMEVYCEKRVSDSLKNEYLYVFSESKYPGLPKININIIDENTFKIFDVEIIPIRVMHLKLPILGYKIGNIAYITDANYISEIEKDKIKGVKVLIINALRKEEHMSHFTLSEALKLIEEIKPEKAYLTHISHSLGLADEVEKELPKNVFLAYDGLSVDVNPKSKSWLPS